MRPIIRRDLNRVNLWQRWESPRRHIRGSLLVADGTLKLQDESKAMNEIGRGP